MVCCAYRVYTVRECCFESVLVNVLATSLGRMQVGIDCGPVSASLQAALARVNYVGRAVNRAARIAAVARTGQVWCSQAAWEEAQGRINEGALGTTPGDLAMAEGSTVPAVVCSLGRGSSGADCADAGAGAAQHANSAVVHPSDVKIRVDDGGSNGPSHSVVVAGAADQSHGHHQQEHHTSDTQHPHHHATQDDNGPESSSPDSGKAEQHQVPPGERPAPQQQQQGGSAPQQQQEQQRGSQQRESQQRGSQQDQGAGEHPLQRHSSDISSSARPEGQLVMEPVMGLPMGLYKLKGVQVRGMPTSHQHTHGLIPCVTGALFDYTLIII